MCKTLYRQAHQHYIVLLLVALLCLSGCRKEELVVNSTLSSITAPELRAQTYKGIYILNEGTMGRNIASLDYFDYPTGRYHRNIFAERNPYIARELGDVGNDLKVYRDKLWAVINSSNLIEVMEATTAKHLTQITVANARYIAFDGDFAYVSSYAGPIGIDPNARLGKVIKIHTESYDIVGECVVGYQPEELAIVSGKLYVANSGGYRRPHYDNRLTCIDLVTFSVERHLPVAPNLHRLKADSYGQLWLSSRGNYRDISANLYVLDTKAGIQNLQAEALGIACSDMTIVGDDLYLYGAEVQEGNSQGRTHIVHLDIRSKSVKRRNFLKGLRTGQLQRPYGIAVNPELGDIFLSDAIDYTNPGQVYCFDAQGQLKWSAQAGIIPSRLVFTRRSLAPREQEPETQGIYPTGQNPYATKVIAYCPAPGQFVNKMPMYHPGDNAESMRLKAERAIARRRVSDMGQLITLGAWGGYIVVAFDHRVENKAGLCDLQVLGNTFEGGSEPGVIYVAQDVNGNGKPDEAEWYRIQGSAEAIEQEPFYPLLRAGGRDLNLYIDYAVCYERPEKEVSPLEGTTLAYIPWFDKQGRQGYLSKNSYHQQAYYPLWVKEPTLEFRGLRLPNNVSKSRPNGQNTDIFVGHAFTFGYADNHPNSHNASAIDIDWAVDSKGQAVRLSGIDFVRIQTGVLSDNGVLGESSTELGAVVDLHLLGKSISSQLLRSNQ